METPEDRLTRKIIEKLWKQKLAYLDQGGHKKYEIFKFDTRGFKRRTT